LAAAAAAAEGRFADGPAGGFKLLGPARILLLLLWKGIRKHPGHQHVMLELERLTGLLQVDGTKQQQLHFHQQS